MKFIVDENIGFSVVYFLRQKGFDVSFVAQDSPGISDKQILKKAFKQKRILITADKDFGDLVFYSRESHKGVILLRLKNQASRAKINALGKLLKYHQKKIAKNFMVVSENKVRIRR